jgi:hypothetical protein
LRDLVLGGRRDGASVAVPLRLVFRGAAWAAVQEVYGSGGRVREPAAPSRSSAGSRCRHKGRDRRTQSHRLDRPAGIAGRIVPVFVMRSVMNASIARTGGRLVSTFLIRDLIDPSRYRSRPR